MDEQQKIIHNRNINFETYCQFSVCLILRGENNMVSRRLFCSCRIPIYRTHKCNFYTLKHSRGIAYNRRLVQQWQQLHHHAFSRFCIKEAGFKNLGHLVLEFSVITPSKLITYQVHIYIKTHLKIFKKHKYLEVRKLHFKKK